MPNAVVHPALGKLRSVFLTGAFLSIKFFFLVIVLIIAVLYLDIGIGHAHIPSRVVEIAPYLLPGNPIPIHARCRELDNIAAPPVILCEVFQNGSEAVHLVPDRQAQTIMRSSHSVSGLTLGDFIGAWGAPDSYAAIGYSSLSGIVYLYWNTKEVSVHAPVNEDSPVLRITYYLRAEEFPFPRHVWRGFAEPDRP